MNVSKDYLNHCFKMLTVAVMLVCMCVVWIWSRRHVGPQPPVHPKAWPLIGVSHLFLFKDPPRVWSTIADAIYQCLRNGDILNFPMGPTNSYLVTDPDDCVTIASTCIDKPYTYNYTEGWIFDSILVLNPPLWNSHRKHLNPIFSQRTLDQYIDVFNERGRGLVDKFATKLNKKFCHKSLAFTHTMQTSYRTAQGDMVPEDDKDLEAYTQSTERLLYIFKQRLTCVWYRSRFLFNRTSLKKEYDEAVKIVNGITNSVVQKRRLKLKECKEDKDSSAKDTIQPFLDILLKDEGKLFTESNIHQNFDLLLVAAYDTTATCLIYTLTLIGSHPRVQDKIYSELKEVFGDSDRDVTKSDLSRLVYLEAVIKESLRLYPPVPAIAREGIKEVKLKDYTMPAGTMYVLCVYGLHRHPIWGEDADQFRPERWLEPGGVPNNCNAFGAFSFGRRNCIGKVYAMMSLKTTLAHLLRRYRITGDVTNMVLKYELFLKPVSGHEITVELRT